MQKKFKKGLLVTASLGVLFLAGTKAHAEQTHMYQFGTDVTEKTVFNDETGFGLIDYRYPEAAKGWVDNVYYERKAQNEPGATFVEASEDSLALKNLVWTETEESGYGVYRYENTTGFAVNLDPQEYLVTVTFTNPTDNDYQAMVEAENITKVTDLYVPAGQEMATTFGTSLIDGTLDLKFFNSSNATSESDALEQTVYVKNVAIELAEAKQAGDKPTLYLASDSTVQSYDEYYQPQTGWGETLWDFFGEKIEQREVEGASYTQAEIYEAENAIVENRAIGGRSSKSFVEEGKLDELLDDIKPNDYLFVQFGHNDATAARPNRFVAVDDFKNWMQKYVDGAKQRGAIPVLVTPVARYSYNEDGFKEDFKAYGDVIREMAVSQNLPLVDLSQASVALCNEFGVEGALSFFLHVKPGEYEGAYANGATDSTHLQYYGAYKFAQLVAKEITTMDVSALDEGTQQAVRSLAEKVVFEESKSVPDKIEGLKVSSTGSTSATLAWEETKGAELYHVYRQELTEGQDPETIDFETEERYAVSVQPTFMDKKIEKGKEYVYAIRGFNDKGLGDFSEKVTVRAKNSEYMFDINWQNSPTLEGWTGVNHDTVYSKKTGYGFKKVMDNGRHRKNSGSEDANANDMGEDFTLAAGEFMVDLPNGLYEVTVYAGDLLANTSTIKASYTMEGKEAGSISARREVGTLTTNVTVEDGQLNIGIGGTNPYFNGCEITPILLAPSGVAISEKSVEGTKMSFLIGFNPVENASAYTIYGKKATDKEYEVIKTFTAKEYQEDELACRAMIATVGENYQYYMTATMEDGTETAKSNVVELEALDPSIELPEKPSDLKITEQKDALKTFAWTKDDKATEYVVYRSEKADDDFVVIGTTTEATYTDMDQALLANHTYYYQVQAKNKGGVSEKSEILEIKPLEGSAIATPAETLTDRGLVAINLAGAKGGETVVSATDKNGKEIKKGIYLSWRSFAEDDQKTTYDVYRGKKKVASKITDTNFIDKTGKVGDVYKVVGSTDKALGLNVIETTPWNDHYLELQLFKPEDQTMPDGNVVSYKSNDISVGDLDGDGQLDLIVKWDAGGQDNSKGGYTGTTILDGYTVDFSTGKTNLLWRIDLGVNIRAGAHYTQFQVWDYDGDGKAEIAVKTADGSTTYKSTDGTDKTLEETGFVGAVNADSLPTDTISKEHDYRNDSGYILSGPEYFSMFNGDDGTLIGTTDYVPARGNVNNWGDGYGNRVDRFLAGTAYLDGQAPYAVMGRGYYTRTALTAYYLADTDGDGIGDSIRVKATFDSDEAGKEYESQGNHNLSIADVDGDGKDEVIYGSIAFDDDLSVLYNTGLGHGDAMHLGDLIPERPGLEMMAVKEETGAKYHVTVQDAATGEILMGYQTGSDTGRGAASDIDPTSPGAEFWAIADADYDAENGSPAWDSTDGAVYASTSTLDNLEKLADTNPAANGLMYWDGDLLREIQDHVFNEKDGYVPISTGIYKWDYQTNEQETLFDSSEVYTINGTKGNPGISGDLLGDWREEMILRSSDDDSKVRIYSTTIPTDYVIPTLLSDRQYREGLAWQNTAYNQPPHTSYLLSEGVLTAQVSAKQVGKKANDVFFTEASDGINGHEVSGYQIWRREKGTEQAKLLKTIKNKKLEKTENGFVYHDKTAKKDTEYEYAVAAVVNDRASYLSHWSQVEKEDHVVPEKIKLNFSGIKTLKKGKTLQVEVTATPEDADLSGVTFQSNREEIATIDENGKITAIKDGTAKITATVGEGVSASFTLRVTK